MLQVIDLLGELTARGLDPATAAAVLDSGVLCVALSFWVAAAPHSRSSSSNSSRSSSSRSSRGRGGGSCGPSLLEVEAASGAEDSSTHSSSSNSTSAHLSSDDGAATGAGNDPHTCPLGDGHQSPAQFAAALMLDGGQVPLRSFQTFVVTDSSHHFFSKRLAVEPGEGWRRWVDVWGGVGEGGVDVSFHCVGWRRRWVSADVQESCKTRSGGPDELLVQSRLTLYAHAGMCAYLRCV